MNPIFQRFNDIPRQEEEWTVVMSHGDQTIPARSGNWFCQLPVYHNPNRSDFPAMPAPVTWRNVKPHWR